MTLETDLRAYAREQADAIIDEALRRFPQLKVRKSDILCFGPVSKEMLDDEARRQRKGQTDALFQMLEEFLSGEFYDRIDDDNTSRMDDSDLRVRNREAANAAEFEAGWGK